MSIPYPKRDAVAVREMRTPSEPSLSSRKTGKSDKEPALITSTWGIGWRTPTLVIACYVLALVIAIAHLLLFRYIDGKETDGPNQVAPQSYISTASNILANAFGFALRAALAVAFCQYLWRLLRLSAMKVSTIETLFSIRTNLFMLFVPAALRATPTLCALAVLMWASQIVTSFPPGAITVTTRQQASFDTINIPIFNASFMGNGSGVDAAAFSLAPLNPHPPSGFTSTGFSQLNLGKNQNLLNRISKHVLSTGETFAMPSPCGSNCSFVTEFEGPYMNCTTNTATETHHDPTDPFTQFPIYLGNWSAPAQTRIGQSLVRQNYTTAQFNSFTLTPMSVNFTTGHNVTNVTVELQRDMIICTPGRAKYNVNYTYENNVQQRKISATPIGILINLQPPTHDNVVIVPGLAPIEDFGTGPAQWDTDALNFYRDNNHMAIFRGMMSWLSGYFIGELGNNGSPLAPATPGPFNNLTWLEPIDTSDSGGILSLGAQNGTIIDSTRFNAIFDHFSTTGPTSPQFNMSQATLNDYLFNLTTSIMMSYNMWSTTSNATTLTAVNVYSFSRPLNLILPYFISLLVSIPFIVMGGVALWKNGVSAMDGGFMQTIATSTGSAILDRAAAGGCLGGNESMPQELKDLKIRFGELVGREDPGRVKRAGFGVESEVTALKRGANYGIARWI